MRGAGRGSWLSALLMLSLVGCTVLSPPKPPAAEPPPPVAETPTPSPATPEAAPAAPPPAAPAPPPREAPAVRPPRPAPPSPLAQRAPAAPAPAAAQRGRFVVLNFDNADIETVIHAASEIVPFNYVLAPDVRGKVTVQTSTRIPQEEVFNVLLAILEVHGFTAVKAESLYKIIKLEGARERPVPTVVGAAPDPGRVGDEVITQIVPIRFATVADLATLIRPLISQRGSLIAHRETNLLILTDAASNIRRLLEIIRLVDVEVALEELQVIPVRFADAQELAQILNQIFAAGRRPTAPAPAAAPAPPAAPATPAAPAAPPPAADRPPLIVAYRGINVLIVHARRSELELIRRLLAQLDVDIYGGRRVFIYYAENAKAKELTATLNAIYGAVDGAAPARPPGTQPGAPAPPATGARPAAELGLAEGQVRFIADEVTNAVIVVTFPRVWPEIEDTLKKLDRMPRQVLIEVLVAEVRLTDDMRLGIDWALKEGKLSLFQAPGGTLSFSQFPALPATVAGLTPAGLTATAFQTDKFFALLNALATDNKVNVLLSPSILTAENKKAVINVSESVPVPTQQIATPVAGAAAAGTPQVSLTQSVEFKDAGIILTVTPRIGEKGTVALDVRQEVNEVVREADPLISGVGFSFRKREAEASVVLTNNQTLALGGLIRNRRTLSRTGIPFLNRIPLLGLLFGRTEESFEKTELLILITPRVLGTALDAARITEEMKQVTPELRDAIRQAPRQ
jgi:general secretion pathway protein D